MGIINEKKRTSSAGSASKDSSLGAIEQAGQENKESNGGGLDDKTSNPESNDNKDFIKWIEKDGKFVLTGSTFDADVLKDSALKLSAKLEGGEKHNFLTTCCRAFGWDLSQLNNDIKSNSINQDEADEKMTDMIEKSVDVAKDIRSFSDEPPKVTSIDLNDKKIKSSSDDEEKPDDSFENDEEF